MKTITIVCDFSTSSVADDLAQSLENTLGDFPSVEVASIDRGSFASKRSAKKIANDYAVTMYPFVVLKDNEEVTGAVYSEEGPVTVERILNKLNDNC